MPAPKFSKTEREAKMAEAARLDCLGWNSFQIGEALGVSRTQASQYLRNIRLRYAEDARQAHAGAIGKTLNQLAYTSKEVTEAWERSKLPAEKTVTKEVPVEDCSVCAGSGKRAEKKIGKRVIPGGPCTACGGKGSVGGVVEVVKTVEDRLPDPAYQSLFLKVLEGVREVLGLDAPKQVVNKNENTNIEHWNVLVTLDDSAVGDKVGPKLVEALEAAKGKKLPCILKESTNGESEHKESEE